MAKPKDADVEVEGQGIDSETVEMLEGDVKKGKARKFILIYKGAQIKTLIVFKKGPYQTRIQKAKKDGFKGDAICGIVTGSGVNLAFQLPGNKEVADAMKADAAVDDEPTKSTKLKEFLAENNLARKPEYQIIRDVKALVKADEDDAAAPSADGASAGAAAASAAPPKSAGGPPAAGGAAAAQASAAAAKQASKAAPPPQTISTDKDAAANGELAAKIKKIKDAVVPKIKEAVEADPASKEKITKLLQSASDREKQRAFGDAFQFFKTLAETVSTVLGGGNPKQQYEEALPGAELKVKTLKEHPQAAAIKAELDPIERSLKLAKSLAQGGKYADALKELAKIDKEYPDAKELADTIKLAREIESSMVIQLNNFELHQGIGAIAPDKVAELRTAIGSLDGLIKARKFGDFDTVNSDVNGKLDAYKVKANRHGDYVGLRNNALVNVEALEAHPNKEAIKDKIAAIKKDFIDKAKVEYETNNSYEKARALLEQVEGKYKDAKKLADDKGGADFKKEVDAIKLKVADLEKPEKKNPELDAEVAAIKTKLATAEKYAAAKQYPDADKLLEEIKQACTAAEKLAAEQVAFNGDEKAAGAAIGDIAKKSQAAVDAVQKLHDRLGKHTNASAITFELGEIQKKIDEAKAALK